MNQKHLTSLLLLIGLFSIMGFHKSASAEDGKYTELLVEYEETRQSFSAEEELPGVESRENIADQVELWSFTDAKEMKIVKEQLLEDPGVLHVEPNYERYSHISYDDLDLTKQWWIPQVKPRLIWARAAEQQKDAVVAVIDSGIDLHHEDLQGRIQAGGFNFYADNWDVQDMNGHGTAVAGVIAADTGSHLGVAGIAGTYNVRVLPLKISHVNGTSKVSNAIKAIDYALAKKVDVINLSFGSSEPSLLEEQAIKRAVESGITVVASAGNSAEKGNEIMYPASYADVISVGATDPLNKRASFSNYNKHISLVAPGTAIFTTAIHNRYQSVSGTSFSGPVVAGAAAVVKSLRPHLAPSDMKRLLESSATDLGVPGKDPHYGAGLLNISMLHYLLPGGNEPSFTGDFPDKTVKPAKVFTVRFSHELNMAENYHPYIDITRSPNSADRQLDFTARVNPADRKELLISPNTHWDEGIHYLRVQDGLPNTKNEPLKKSVIIKFIVQPK
ncbi:S8 family serine peptidase [Sporosarcina sp. P33]|uniref:S8 family peptidase n=1 Tax=Sporosarcina sp. P33 TaxID=1930764 RepID=UPI0009C1AD11|nr:S8 family serine peptidase [Sporosarcina sp. P33]ARD48888.1 hypothetical protein SporoP33_12060 [Sporosarcina sp. P33]